MRYRSAEPDILARLSANDQRRLLAGSEELEFKRREYLFRQGEPITGLFLVCAGTVKLSQLGPDGHEVVMHLARAGDPIAAIAAFPESDRFPVGAIALDAVSTRFWPRTVAQELARELPAFASALTYELTRRALGFQQRLRELATEKVPQRLARTLLRLAEQAGVDDGGVVRIDIPLTRQDLAQMTGTTLFTVSRLLSEWAEQGLVEVGRARVALRSIEGVRKQAVPPEGDGG